ncbi:HCLS1-associated protein X-1-like isoform X1 [Phymastichus coffea]|uniref:HCLS1-associated protein X-1-like isoform X1 n=1 Tax=Phymastichus coffea TaxID=108790 RepID=UPI00273C61CA|nr:HCLS1-associated protein X-1-like isoform X1 [Phymastichus coffea]
MPFFDFFRNFFGRSSKQEPPQYRFDSDQSHRDSFKHPIWENDEDEDDINDFRQPRNRFQFRVFSDPFEMTRFFETQMDDMMRNFFGTFDGFGNRFGPNTFGNDFPNALPMPEEKVAPVRPRDEVLKSDEPNSSRFFSDDFSSIFTTPSNRITDKGPCQEVLKPSYEMPSSNKKKLDSDIDGKIKSDELAKIWKPSGLEKNDDSSLSVRSFGNSVSTQIIRRPDGSMEERRTVRDTDGNEEIRVTRQIGNKKHTIVTQKTKDGSETKTEDVVNMDENELNGFNEKWKKIQVPSDNSSVNFPWHKFFGPNPKL